MANWRKIFGDTRFCVRIGKIPMEVSMKQILLLLVLLFSVTFVFAQESTIDKAEFDKMMMGSFQALRNKPHRSIEESILANSFSSPMKYKTISEVTNLARRSIYESDSASIYSKTETIFINGKRYTKKMENPWIEEKIENKPTPNNYETISNEVIYKSLGEKVLNDKKAKVYQTVSFTTRVNKEKGGGYSVNEIVTYYFDDTGLMFRSETNSEMINKPKAAPGSAFVQKETKSTTKRIKTVEIDQNIKIEEPQIG